MLFSVSETTFSLALFTAVLSILSMAKSQPDLENLVKNCLNQIDQNIINLFKGAASFSIFIWKEGTCLHRVNKKK